MVTRSCSTRYEFNLVEPLDETLGSRSLRVDSTTTRASKDYVGEFSMRLWPWERVEIERLTFAAHELAKAGTTKEGGRKQKEGVVRNKYPQERCEMLP